MGYKSIGRRIQLAREEAGLSQEQLAAKIGCSQSTLSHYEQGKRRLYLAQLEKIAQVLQKPIDYFFQPVEEKSAAPHRSVAAPDDAEIQAVLDALQKLSPASRKLVVDFVLWMKEREEAQNG
ncbi:Transcriptional regulator, contains XRE-family HTH domain [Desulfofundulus australicus DSM 11792]|uniref:Transcriptional regulator, contains XRE-family HTH domain n=1 Tax=Desulfofundulus australicus DSM 11792 TaxID=1121425 RepID=A0A1M4YHG2_9FIRM|nr:helix-turn-helix transcriptional regulator [Desulfofundulus australicus]SHF05217.1 Transcriptional regulator, contains XRE-family HTH domain [Desulfofundulus australicus DSM 11792]